MFLRVSGSNSLIYVENEIFPMRETPSIREAVHQAAPHRVHVSATTFRDKTAEVLDMVSHDRKTVSVFQGYEDYGDTYSHDTCPKHERPMAVVLHPEEYFRLIDLERSVKALAATLSG